MSLTSIAPLTQGFGIVWQHDPAVERSGDDFADRYRVALDRLDFGSVVKSGEQPSIFHFRLITGMQLRELLAVQGGDIGALHMVLAFRMALDRIEHFDAATAGCPSLGRKVDGQWPRLGPMQSADFVDWCDRLSAALGCRADEFLPVELGAVVLTRSMNLRPNR